MASAILASVPSKLGQCGWTAIRCMATKGSTTTWSSSSTPQPSYTYLPPGCSMREPSYISVSEPVYFYDLPPTKPEADAAAAAAPSLPGSKQGSKEERLPFSSISGPQKPDTRPISYRMVDDFAQQTYTVSGNHSMREPKYVSISEPNYAATDKK